MITVRNIFLILVIVALSFTWGCGSKNFGAQESALDRNWGKSLESIKYSQTLHPEAGGIQPVEGLHGQNAEQINQQHQKMFSEEPESFQGTTTN